MTWGPKWPPNSYPNGSPLGDWRKGSADIKLLLQNSLHTVTNAEHRCHIQDEMVTNLFYKADLTQMVITIGFHWSSLELDELIQLIQIASPL